ncbi:hypothetical protein F7734_26505 [Scytonema sp. UIC 10036]|uniref:hypothetical protein n=1 Tax=Scytonema sp. UIC 10036 TaxID=2304196 RepID=UPI0012DA44C6|nr:hypothetical protein [Scytonema sp. UIC 10036]MUG95714.1 hypothetical protein [Scytonema sp. UIC 10036]
MIISNLKTLAVVGSAIAVYSGSYSFAHATETKTVKQLQTNISEVSVLNKNQQKSSAQPTVGTIKELVTGDLMCYVTLLDEKNLERRVGASFEICAKEKTFLNKKVRLTYGNARINDCQSIEPCGKTRIETIVTKMEIVGSSQAKNSANTRTITNGQWTVTIGNINSWSGVNGTGNLTYRGCDSQGKCINLTGGKMTCRQGICTMTWNNKDYKYNIQQAMGNPDRPSSASSTILTVRQGSKVILTARGFKTVGS